MGQTFVDERLVEALRLRTNRGQLLLGLVAMTLACNTEGRTGPGGFGPVPVVAITESLSDSLDPAGFFPAGVLVEEPVDALTPAEARRLANAYYRTFADGQRARWGTHRGASIPPSTFRACGPTLAAEGAYRFDSPPVADLARSVAGRYLIHGCSADGDVVALLSVSAQGSADTSQSGFIVGVPPSNTFFSYGVPLALTDGLVLSAERAAELAHELSGRRVAAVPRLVSSLHPDAPHFARWEVRLEDSVTASGIRSSTPVTTVEVLIGFDESVYVVSAHRMLRTLSTATALDPADSLPAHDFAGDSTYWVPAHVRVGRARGVEPIIRVP